MANKDERFNLILNQSNYQIKQYSINKTEQLDNLMNVTKFCKQYLLKNEPFIIRGVTKIWPAYNLWQQDSYLQQVIGNQQIEVEVNQYNEKVYASCFNKYKKMNMTYNEFIQKYQDENDTNVYYFAQSNIPDKLKKDIIEPKFATIMNLEEINLWQSIEGTESLPHTDLNENLLCQISGYKEIILVPPTQRQFLYAGQLQGGRQNYSPVDFFNPDFGKFPDFRQVQGMIYAKIEPGDMLYIPMNWWHHVKSSKSRNLAVNFWYTASFFYQLIVVGLEDQNI